MFRPSRLVNVGSSDGRIAPRLVETKSLPIEAGTQLSYATLSHCWGTVPMAVTTTTDTLSSHLTGFDVERLPKTFLHAITIARELGIHWIWIDSLCILQDDADDWRRESAMMASIYSCSYLTIAAASAHDSTEGCFVDRAISSDALAIDLQPVPLRGYARFPSHRRGEFRSSPLHSRAWVLQEVVLSRRTVYFTRDQWYWQCHTARNAEDDMIPGEKGFAIQEDLAERAKSDPKGLRPRLCRFIDSGVLALYDLSTPVAAASTWWMWVLDFSSRKLTKRSDRYAAFAGLTKRYQEETGDRPLLGLWESRILWDLLWTVRGSDSQELRTWCVAPLVVERYDREAAPKRLSRGRDSRQQLKDTPTWTWYAAEGLDINEPKPHLSTGGVTYFTRFDFIAKYLAGLIDWSAEELTSTLLEASILLQGPVGLVQLQDDGKVTPLGKGCEAECSFCRPEKKRGNAMDVSWDYYPPLEEIFWCLLIAYGKINGQGHYVGLVLKPTGEEGEFQRQGVFASRNGLLCYKTWDEMIINLV